MIVTALWVILVAWYFGLKERARLGRLAAESIGVPLSDDDPETPCATDPARRRYFWINLAITAALMTALLTALLPLAVLFLLPYAVAAPIHYPSIQATRRHLAAQAGHALSGA